MDNALPHQRWLLEVPEAAEDALGDWLGRAGATATFRSADPPYAFYAYFPPDLAAPDPAALAGFPGVRLVRVERFADEDWLARSREGFGPIQVGRGFHIRPLWEDGPAPAGRVAIAVNPGLAFGTGGHETTRLCMGLIEDLADQGALQDPVLDIGAGTGILALTAWLCGARQVTAFDIDPDCGPAMAGLLEHNARLLQGARPFRRSWAPWTTPGCGGRTAPSWPTSCWRPSRTCCRAWRTSPPREAAWWHRGSWGSARTRPGKPGGLRLPAPEGGAGGRLDRHPGPAAAMTRADLPIGVFDSGIGGLTVVRALRRMLPEESIVYLGDTAQVPYGNKSHGTIQRYALQAGSILARHEPKLMVIACNTASAHGLAALQASARARSSASSSPGPRPPAPCPARWGSSAPWPPSRAAPTRTPSSGAGRTRRCTAWPAPSW